ncbi:MAG: zinc dependent phospholipase C family protein [Gemmatimonadetes bacterium]|nr:zinc dependent phospholipase C family protein [Gemmatimonadota bacterium]NNF14953.1 zinc dependent phospholipase C family protein [Gemmatimonadota bacterium]NNL30310.1 zinc dependent phospholipase C family protein [Gemmatimonadota bacterium]
MLDHGRTLVAPFLVAVGWLLLAPDPVAAWGPATHIALGEATLGALYLLPPAIRAVLERYPLHFLYGSVAADISLAKKYVPEGRHCHNWEIGEEILHSADSERLQSVGYGYLAHLAADTIAHNYFVPRRLLLTSTTQALGHTYWEHRMDMHVGEDFLNLARHIVVDHDHSEADELFDDVLSRTLFSFSTNRRIFQGMIRFTGHERWQKIFQQVLANSRFDLPNPTVDRYFELAFDYVIGYLRSGSTSTAAGLDPVGDLNLRLAKKIRRRAMADGAATDPDVLRAMADDFFELPSMPLLFWPQIQDAEFASGISSAVAAGRTLPGTARQ